ncbi:hypothetical protein IGS68_29225 (plasmid) [Skermanella sp. TT6]|uniref:Uncharacterized protein n=1 Tax=Skermanella cutis TaxID=2775420 RepID=A0ABX7BFN0_9PROT|nr:hypothetical protein [Skermanella sp. TT6]QQP93207.1 hypothetical protein IGS68_29225 [Skermanella sp. TT6]
MPNEIMIEGLLVRDGNGYLYFVPDEHLDLTQLQLPEDQQPGGDPMLPDGEDGDQLQRLLNHCPVIWGICNALRGPFLRLEDEVPLLSLSLSQSSSTCVPAPQPVGSIELDCLQQIAAETSPALSSRAWSWGRDSLAKYQPSQHSGLLVRGEDGTLSFIPDTVMEAYRLPEKVQPKCQSETSQALQELLDRCPPVWKIRNALRGEPLEQDGPDADLLSVTGPSGLSFQGSAPRQRTRSPYLTSLADSAVLMRFSVNDQH